MADNYNKNMQELERVLTAAKRGMELAMLGLQTDTALRTHVISGDLKRSWTFGVEQEGSVIYGAVGSNIVYAPVEDNLHPNISAALNADMHKIHKTIANQIAKR